jgi:hypothetical protein
VGVGETARHDDALPRSIAAFAVIALHVVLVVELGRLRRGERDLDEKIDGATTMIRIVPVIEDRADLLDDDIARVPTDSGRTSAEKSSEPQSIVEPSQIQAPSINWRANAVRSAQLAVDESTRERYRSFGPREEPTRSEESVPSVFEDKAKHESGDVGEGVNGDPVVWMNENCYTTLDRSVQTARDWVIAGKNSFAPASINCVGGESGSFSLVLPNPASFTPPSLNYSIAIGRREPNGKLFEHLKKKEEPPAPKVGTEMNELPREIEAGEVFER